MRARNVLFTIAVVIVAAAGAGWFLAGSQPEVTVASVTRGPAVAAVYATGTVEPITWAKVGPTVTGRIMEIFVRDGAKVSAGQPLVRLDDREARARLAELEAREKYWSDEMQRQTTLADRGVASREQRDRTQSELLAVRATIEQARQRVTDLTLVAPMDGVVLRQDGEIGETVDNKAVLFWVGQPLPLRITSDVDEEDIPRVRFGQRALIKADAFPGQALEGRVADITLKGDPVNKNYRVRIALPDDTPLRIGMTTEINIVVQEIADAILVPVGAVRQNQVFAVIGGVARAKRVEVGIEGRTMIEIKRGVALGDTVVVNPPASLGDGMRVRVIGRPEPAAGPGA